MLLCMCSLPARDACGKLLQHVVGGNRLLYESAVNRSDAVGGPAATGKCASPFHAQTQSPWVSILVKGLACEAGDRHKLPERRVVRVDGNSSALCRVCCRE